MLYRNTSVFLPLPFCMAFLGAVFCLWNAWSISESVCLAAGCTLFQDITIAGISMWWIGATYFILMCICAFMGRIGLTMFLSGLGVFIDCLLLIILLLTSPCLPCLAVAFAFALTYLFTLIAAQNKSRNPKHVFSFLLIIWGCLFISNLSLVAKLSVGSWAILEAKNQQQEQISIYFSPSCPSCIKLVNNIPGADAERVNWYPVAEKDKDLIIINKMNRLVKEGQTLPQALKNAMESETEPSLFSDLKPKMLLLQIKLWINKARVLEANGGVLPYIEFSGLPSFMVQQSSSRKNILQSTSTDHNLPSELTISGSCNNIDVLCD